MARSKSLLTIQLEYYPLLALFRLLGFLPRAWSDRLARALVRGLTFFIPGRQKLMDANLSLCFPQLTATERLRLAEQSIDNIGRGLAVYPRMARISKEGLKDQIEVTGLEHLEKALQQGQGAITFTAHYGCWELLAVHIPRLFQPGGVLVRQLDNPRLETLVAAVRSSGGSLVIPHRRIFKDGLRILRCNGVVGMLVDQNFAPGGVFVDFFGRLAATTPIVSVLARRTGCAVVPVHTRWEGQKIWIIFEPSIGLSAQADPALAAAEDTQKITKIIEGWIRTDPSQWLWLHNRWKRQPMPGEIIYPLQVAVGKTVRTQ